MKNLLLVTSGTTTLVFTVLFAQQSARVHTLSAQIRQLQNPQQEADEIVAKVRSLIDLPGNPTVAAIVNVEKLRKQHAFYAKAENGDFVLITSTRAVLYDPESERILDVVPVTSSGSTK